MKTKDKIKEKATELFNVKGVKNVTLREVAQALDKSYGNITYHFKTKAHLILDLYEDMLGETNDIMRDFDLGNVFLGILEAPKKTFKISMKYLFFYVDYVEIRRTYEDIYARVEKDNTFRKTSYLQLLIGLQTQGILREELTPKDLDYLMDLSGAMRTFFFINLHPDRFIDPELEDNYVYYVNQLVFPYLTPIGVLEYNTYLKTKN